MKTRGFLHRQWVVTIALCPVLLFLMTDVEFNQPKLFKPAEYQLTPQFFRFVSCGFWPVAADWLWMQTLQQAAQNQYSKESLPETLGFYRLISELDPNFYETYDQSAILFAFFYEDANAAIEMISRGIKVFEGPNPPPEKFWTHPYSLYLYRAYANAFLRNDWLAAKSDYLAASYIHGAPPYLTKMRGWLQKEGSENQLAVKVLKLLILNAKDPLVRSRYEEKLKRYE